MLRLAHRLRVSPDQPMRRAGLADVEPNSQARAKSGLHHAGSAPCSKHTVKIVAVATAGRPAVTTDGIVYLK
ncbi:hypothetical protein ABZ137_14635 [Streptomyces bobili]|uniref:hypothetical protein n=1 Tax=Streptomyces bobili TaxID=67280 RepID=UPI0033A2FC28